MLWAGKNAAAIPCRLLGGERAGSGCCPWAEATRQGKALPPAAYAVWWAGPLESAFPGWDLGVPSSALFCRGH